jgi:UDP-N-acetylmuramoylalanine--D-glutamate ligase
MEVIIFVMKKIKGIEFYNDAYSTNPIATLNTIKNLSIDRNIILIFGGAYTRYDYRLLINLLPQYIKAIILLPGSGTLCLREDIKVIENISFNQVYNLDEAVVKALELAKKGDRVVFSPGCEAIGIYSSRKERGEDFVRAVRSV